jgi:hypothetical protein
MARLTVSVPQDLHDRLDRWRDNINISRICQEALERELRRLEELPQDAIVLGDMVKRLSAEKADGDQHWFSQGVADGMTWARGAAYVDLKEAAMSSLDASPGAKAAVRKGATAHRSQPGFETDAYESGWRFAAAEIWRRVEAKL